MNEVSFKERIKNIAIYESKNYKKFYVDYEYLICSDAFIKQGFYIIDAKKDNYQHLLGINSLISPQDFFDKCYSGMLQESDFDFQKHGQAEKSVKGSIRRKIKVLPNMMNLFTGNDIKVEEMFVKNQVICNLATADNECTLGFISTPKSRPMTLLAGNMLDKTKMKDVSLLLRKENGTDKFNEIIIGDMTIVMYFYERIKDYIDESLIPISIKEAAAGKE